MTTETPNTITFSRDLSFDATLALATADAVLDSSDAMALIATARIAIPDDEGNTAVAELATTLKASLDELTKMQVEHSAPVGRLQREIVALYKPTLDRLDSTVKICRTALAGYQSKLAQKRREDQAKADRDARVAREELTKAAATAEDTGDPEKADALRAAAAATTAHVATSQSTTPSAAGISKPRDNWRCEVSDPKLVPPEFWVIDLQRLGAHVRNMGSSLVDGDGNSKIPGVKIWNEGSVGISAKRAGKS